MVRRRQPSPLLRCPALEFWRLPHVKAVEERPGIQRGRAFEIACLYGVFELGDVTRHDRRVKPEICCSSDRIST